MGQKVTRTNAFKREKNPREYHHSHAAQVVDNQHLKKKDGTL
jgi:hypothetical protein